ncbi:MAG: YceD family protein [Candidatus Cryptobacteroides sp.]
MNEPLIIALNGLTAGRKEYRWNVGREFFNSFGNEDILDADISIEASAVKAGQGADVDCRVEGTVTVRCDRCLAELKMKVSPSIRLNVRYGHEAGIDDSDPEREVITVPETDTELDMSQVIYDYVCLDLPITRIHPEGECDESVAGRLGTSTVSSADSDPSDSPFASLNGLFKN